MADITTISCPREWAAYCRKQAAQGKSIGFVPTMGALHQGHASLMQQSLQENDLTMLSIFVNPAQFNDAGDLDKYPRTLEDDLKIASDLGVNAVFLPNAENMYPDGYEYRLTET
ncbi:MAG: pantoate--beta-alanine ligase, partial [Spirochaetaceae bacterium]